MGEQSLAVSLVVLRLFSKVSPGKMIPDQREQGMGGGLKVSLGHWFVASFYEKDTLGCLVSGHACFI